MEPLTRRIGLHIYTDKEGEVIAFYRDLVGMRIAKDVLLIDGKRWVTLVKEDNIGIQFHIHSPNPMVAFRPFRADLSVVGGEYNIARNRFLNAGYPIKEFELPYADGFDVIDPVGNEITLSWWGELDHDDHEGWDTEFLDYGNCTAPITKDIN